MFVNKFKLVYLFHSNAERNLYNVSMYYVVMQATYKRKKVEVKCCGVTWNKLLK